MSTIRRFIGEIYHRLPEHRKTKVRAHGAWKLMIRKILYPYFQFPVVISNAQGVRLRITDDEVDEQIVYHMLSNVSYWYFPEESFRIKDKPIILDLGAHHGFYTLFALGYYAESRVICVEPSLKTLQTLKKNIALNNFQKRVRIVPGALAESAGTGYLSLQGKSWSYELTGSTSDRTTVETVQLLTLSEILNGDKPDIIKCNAEGGEYALVRQINELNLSPWLVIVMVHAEKGLGSISSLVSQMEAMNYTTVVVKQDKLRPVLHFWKQTR